MDTNLTTSTVLGFAERLEEDSTRFYEELSEIFSEDKAFFLSFVREGKRNRILISRTYQETISDALEACFSFSNLNLNDFTVNTRVPLNLSRRVAMKIAMELEEKATKFYLTVADGSSLLATISIAFKKVAEIRKNREQKLWSLLSSDESRETR